jgi:archaemetzincin
MLVEGMRGRFFQIVLLLAVFSCRQKAGTPRPNGEEDARIAKLATLDQQMPPVQPGDWLYVHEESGQTFEQYKASDPVRADSTRIHFYLRPIGSFSEHQMRIVNLTAEYLKIFYGMEAIVEEPVSDESIPGSARRSFDDGSEQLLTTYLFDHFLLPGLPDDAVAVMAITTKDLYPSPAMNYVFGQARLQDRVGVSSLFRYTDGPLDDSNFKQCLMRMIKTSSHEMGHMFSCKHCTHAVCVMNGTNSLWESDSRPNRLCSECLHKLHWNLAFDLDRRQKKLVEFMTKHGLTEDAKILMRDLQVLQSEKPSNIKGLYD